MPSLKLTRRTMLATSAASFALATWNKTGLTASTDAHSDVADEIRTITPPEADYAGWPTLTRTQSGRLIVVWSGGRESHVCPFGRVEMMTSDDEGATWSWPRVLLDGAIDDRDAGILETSKGTLLVTTFTSLAYVPQLEKATASNWPADRLDRWQRAHGRVPGGAHEDLLGTWMIRSTDGGVSWSAQYDSVVNSPHGPTELADGRLLYAGKQLWKGEKKIGVAESTDDGQSWRWLSEIPTRPGDSATQYHELHAIETAPGTVIAQIRNHNKTNHYETLQTESHDGGATWSEPHSIGVWGYPSHLVKLADGRIVMSYGHRRAPLGIQARTSDDGGQTWSAPIVVYGQATSSDLGYPSTVPLSDGRLLTVWYEKLKSFPKAVLRQAVWNLPT